MLKNVMIKTGVIAAAIAMFASMNVHAATKTSMKSAKEVVNEMGIGWNLGNTLDSHGEWIDQYTDRSVKAYETGWGNPETTKAMIDKVKEGGFKTVRVPVTWGPHIGSAPSYTVDKAWLDRVEEVVDYAIDDGLYVILNVHHDEEWCAPTYANEEKATDKLEALWNQIATRFEDYDYHLIFETLNEPRLLNSTEEWIGGTKEGREVVNNFNEAALKTIRATGGNNEERSVMIPTYGASGTQVALDDYRVQDDKNVIVSLHAYTPYLFAMTQTGSKEWGTAQERTALVNELTYYHNFFDAKGVPVVLGEFGTIDKNNTAARVEHAKTYVETATKLGIPCCWWDNNYLEDGKDNTYKLLDRASLTWAFPEVKDALINTYNSIKGNNNDNKKPEIPGESDKRLELTTTSSIWPNGYQLNVNIKNTSKEAVEGWTLKIKKDNINITNFWCVDCVEDGDYIVVTPKPWTVRIEAGQTVSFGIQGQGTLNSNIQYELIAK